MLLPLLIILSIYGSDGLVVDCNFVQMGTVCPLTMSNVIDIEHESDYMDSAEGCQYMCFIDEGCKNFTYFANEGGMRCIMFRSCETTMPCNKCLSGPDEPPIMKCSQTGKRSEALTAREEGPEITTFRPKQIPRLPKQIEGDDNSNDTEFIDEGLLAGEEPKEPELTTSTTTTTTTTTTLTTTTTTTTTTTISTTETTTTPSTTTTITTTSTTPSRTEARTTTESLVEPPILLDYEDDEEDEEEPEVVAKTPSDVEEPFNFEVATSDDDAVDPDLIKEGVLKTNTKPMTFYHCMIGGYGPSGPISAVGHVGAAFIQRSSPIISPLPPSYPLGSQGVFSTIYKKKVFVCSPGAAVDNPQFFSFFSQGQRLFQPGQCSIYEPEVKEWQPYGTPLNSYRGGAAMTRMGRFIVASGGNRFPAPLSSIEVLNIKNPEKWKTLSKLILPNPTYDHCMVAVNNTAIFVTGGYAQESQAYMLDLLGKKFTSEEPMKQPRRKHTCVKARVNGRDGVIVAGGSSDADPALNLVEFFDLETSRWMSLGRTREGRRYPGIMVMGKHLLIAGGENTDSIGRTIILDSMETLMGNKWTPLRQKLPERRSRFSLLRIPRNYV